MKQIAYIIAFILVALTAIGAQAEEINEITLTVSSDGSTKDDAIKNALRLAIEQSYGAFVSANTTILNDELVKDEIVTITHGAIKDFKEIAGAQLSDNRYSVTVQATVSLPNLITYAKNHGSECEFAGNTFGMEMKLFNLQKENELKAISNLIPVVRNLCRTTMAWTIKVDEPFILREYNDTHIILNAIGNSSRMIYSNNLSKVLQHAPADTKADFSDILTDPQKYCSVHFEFFWTRIGEDNEVANYLYKALTEISLDRESFDYMEERGYNVSKFSKSSLWFCTNGEESDAYTSYYFRNNYETIVNALVGINKAIREEKLSFHLIDNTGEYSDFKALEYLSLKEEWENCKKAEIKNGGFGTRVYKIPDSDFYFTWNEESTKSGICGINGSGLFKNLFVTDPLKDEDGCFYGFSRDGDGALYVFDDYPAKGVEVYYQNRKKDGPSLSIYVIIPTSEIGKYSSFKIEPK